MLWHHADRPSPDHANARFILLLSAHLESGHYLNPQAQRIIDGKMAGAKIAVMDPRLSNTASMADYWLPTYPGTEAAILLAMAKLILDENRFDAAFLKSWTNWQELKVDGFQARGQSFEAILEALKRHYARYTPEFAEKESGIKADIIVRIAREIADAGSRFASHLWRGSASAQPRRLAIGPRFDAPPRTHRLGRNHGWPQSERMEQVRAASVQGSTAAEALE